MAMRCRRVGRIGTSGRKVGGGGMGRGIQNNETERAIGDVINNEGVNALI